MTFKKINLRSISVGICFFGSLVGMNETKKRPFKVFSFKPLTEEQLNIFTAKCSKDEIKKSEKIIKELTTKPGSNSVTIFEKILRKNPDNLSALRACVCGKKFYDNLMKAAIVVDHKPLVQLLANNGEWLRKEDVEELIGNADLHPDPINMFRLLRSLYLDENINTVKGIGGKQILYIAYQKCLKNKIESALCKLVTDEYNNSAEHQKEQARQEKTSMNRDLARKAKTQAFIYSDDKSK